MRIAFCDRCGQQGYPKDRYSTEKRPYVVSVTMEPMGRRMDLCGECRTALQPVLDAFLAVAVVAA